MKLLRICNNTFGGGGFQRPVTYVITRKELFVLLYTEAVRKESLGAHVLTATGLQEAPQDMQHCIYKFVLC
jgi:hypothetical protein